MPSLFIKPNKWHFVHQPDLVDNLAFWLCSGVRPQNRPIRKKKSVLWADLSDCFPTDGHKAILTKLNSKSQTNRIYDGVEAKSRKSQASFQIIWLMRGSAEHETINLKNQPEISLSRPQHHHWLFFLHIILDFFISTARNEVAIFFLSAQEYKNAVCKNSLKENRTFIFTYLIIKLGKYYPLFCFISVLNIF